MEIAQSGRDGSGACALPRRASMARCPRAPVTGIPMKRAALFASAALAVMGGTALARGGEDPMAQLRACSQMPQADRLECLDRLSRAITSAIPPAANEDR